MKKRGYTGNLLFRRLLPVLLALALLEGCRPSSRKLPEGQDNMMTFAFYNVENLFDTHDDPRSGGDNEFLPSGSKRWDDDKYRNKITGLSEALRDLGEDELPGVVGFCEVENSRVVEELVAAPALAPGNYEVIHYHDRDSRGIDLALAYRPDVFTVDSHRLIPVRTARGGFLARGILAVEGRISNGEEFHVFVTHWPSRDGDEEAKARGRRETAEALRTLADPILKKGGNSHVVIMGDMNDEPADESLLKVLGAVPPGKETAGGLVNLMYPSMERGHGSYKYQGDWKMLDNLVVSASLFDENGTRVEEGRGFVFSNSRMEFRSRGGEVSPDRTYVGDKYTGGISDHFPVYFRIRE